MQVAYEVSNQLFHAMPIPGHAALIHRQLRAELRSSLRMMAESASRALAERYPSLDLSPARSRIDALDVSRRFSPALYVRHTRLADALRKNDVASVVHELGAIAAIEDDNVYAPEYTVSSVFSEPWEDHVLPELRESALYPERQTEPTTFPVSRPRLAGLLPEIERAVALIHKADATIGEEYDEYTARLKIFAGTQLQGGSGNQFFGAIFLREPEPEYDDDERIAFFVEHLVHESSHSHLNALMALDKVLLNSADERYPAPIRPDLRPMSGIFHATFVLSRIVRVLGRLESTEPTAAIRKQLEITTQQFARGAATVEKHAKVTPAGVQILRELRDVAAR